MALRDKPDDIREPQSFTYARLLLAQGRPDEARRLLARLDGQVRAGGRHARLINVRILQALAEAALDRQESTRQLLAEAIQLAAPEGYIRRFLDEGPAVARLLPSVRAVAPAFVGQLQRAFGAVSPDADGTSPPEAAAHPALTESLTQQELNVLRLLAEGRSYQEIADRLVISVSTARWHIHNIYAKLGAPNRTQGINRARELGLL